MAISDYAGLKAEVQIWTARSDSTFGNRFPLFLSYAEDRIYNGAGKIGDALYSPPLRNNTLETTGSITITSGVGSLPERFLGARKLYYDDSRVGLSYLPPERFSVRSASAGGSDPVYYTIRDGSIYLFPEATGTVTCDYWRKMAPLTSDDTTNDLLTNHETVYLSACLFEAFSFIQAPDLALAHLAKLNSAIDGLNATAKSSRYAGASVQIRPRFPIP